MKNCLIMLILLILVSTSVSAFTATTLSGMIQMNLEKVPTTFEKSIGIKNENNESVLVQLIPAEEIKDMITLETTNLTLQPGESRFIKFNLTATEMKKITSSVNIIFSHPNPEDNATEEKFGIATKLVVAPVGPSQPDDISIGLNTSTPGQPNNSGVSENQTGEDKPTSGNSSLARYIISGLIGIAAIILAAFIILKNKAGAKNE